MNDLACTRTKPEARDTAPALGYLVWTKMHFGLLGHRRLGEMIEHTLHNEARTDEERIVAHHVGEVRDTIRALKKRGVTRLRTGISWAEWEEPGGKEWISHYIREYAKHFELLACFAYTPHRLGVRRSTNTRPRRLASYADSLYDVLSALASCLHAVELHNEWDLVTDWDRTHDPDMSAFSAMIAGGALVARSFGLPVVLGGPSGINEKTLAELGTFARSGLASLVDVIGFHNLRGTWSDHSPPLSLPEQVLRIRDALDVDIEPDAFVRQTVRILGHARPEVRDSARHGLLQFGTSGLQEVWLTEYGFPVHCTEPHHVHEEHERIQVALFAHADELVRRGLLDRAYWYTLKDSSDPSVRLVTTGWEDVLQHHFGDSDESGRARILGTLLERGGAAAVREYASRIDAQKLVAEASLARKMPQMYRSQSR